MRRTAIQYDTRRLTGCRYCGQEIEMASSPAGRPIAFDAPIHCEPQQMALITGAVAPIAYAVSKHHADTCPVWNSRKSRKGRR